jgi:hypothetical protein
MISRFMVVSLLQEPSKVFIARRDARRSRSSDVDARATADEFSNDRGVHSGPVERPLGPSQGVARHRREEPSVGLRIGQHVPDRQR